MNTSGIVAVLESLLTLDHWSVVVAGIMDITTSKIVDVSWNFGVTASSSESDKVGKTFLQLRLLLDESGKLTTVFTEMTLSQFYKFLHDLEKAKNSLDLLV